MADNEITYSSSGDIRLAAALAASFLLLLDDRTALIDHPALFYAGSVNFKGTTVLKVPLVGLLGYDLLSVDASENTDVDETALTDGSSTVTVERYTKVYTPTDLNRMVGAMGILEPEMMAMDAMISAQLTLTSLLANLVDNFSNTSGASGVDMDLATLLAADAALDARNAVGQKLAILHTSAVSHIKEELALVSGGGVQLAPATQDMISRVGTGLRGSILGIDIVASNYVPASGSDRHGGMFVRGALAWADGIPPVDNPVEQTILGPGVMYERQRLGTKAETRQIMHRYLGVSEIIDDAGQTIIANGS